MTTKERLIATIGFDDRKLLLLAIPTLAAFIPIIFFNTPLSKGLADFIVHEWLGSILYTASYWLSIRAVFIYMRQRFPAYKDVFQRVLYTVLSILILFLLINATLDYIESHFLAHQHPPGVTEWDYAVASIAIIITISALYESVYFYTRWKETVIEAERLRRENVESQLEGLKNQVNPHFLFNSLNTLIYLIPENPQKAVHFVQMLSKVYRYILEIREKKLITLQEELDFLEAYNFLLKERFGENLHITIKIPETIKNQQIIPLSLQILFENAIKHNIISEDKPLKIELLVQNGHLVVQNNLQKKKQTMPSTKVGLENIRHRYAFFSNDPVEIFSDETNFRVSLPLLKNAQPLALRNV